MEGREEFRQERKDQASLLLEQCSRIAKILSDRPREFDKDIIDISSANAYTARYFNELKPKASVYGHHLNPKGGRLLIISAHPDDSILAMGSLAFAGFEEVFALTCTHGAPGDPRRIPAIAEAILLRVHHFFLGSASDEMGPNLSQTYIGEVTRIINHISPTIIVTHLPFGDPHPCHTRVSDIVTRAVWRIHTIHRPILLYAKPPANYHEGSFRPEVHLELNDTLCLLLTRAIELHPSESLKKFYKVEDHLHSLKVQAATLNRYGLLTEKIQFVESFMLAFR